ncbi:MAG: type II toxin-antitoxin system RelE/ParE family toxin [Nitrospinae bacterium]|nr:type II toxin-antitoxin system RelE/ParE family toxin [Nitrospinota bacterium]
MIKSFKCKDSEKLYNQGFVKKFSGIERQALKRLKLLNATPDLKTLAGIPGNQLEALTGDRKGQYSIRINKQWRVCFKWTEEPEGVEIVDYH